MAIVGGVGLPLEVLEVLDLAPFGLVEQVERAQDGEVARLLGDERFVARDRGGAIVELAGGELGGFALEQEGVFAAGGGELVEDAHDVGPALLLAGELEAHLGRQRRDRGELREHVGPAVGAGGHARELVPVGLRRIFAVGGEERGERARGVVGLVLEHARELEEHLAAAAGLGLDVDAGEGELEQTVEVALLAQLDGEAVEARDGVLARRLRGVEREPAVGVVVLGQLFRGGGERGLDGGDEVVGAELEHAQAPGGVELFALELADAGEERIVLALARGHAGEEALGDERELDVSGVEADEHEGARAPQLGERGAQLAVGERGLQRLVRPHQRLGARGAAEELEHERQLAVGAQGGAVARGEQRRGHFVAHESALEPVVAARGDDAAEGQGAEAHGDVGRLGAVAERRAQRRGEAIAEAARDEAGGGERARLQDRPHLAHVLRRQRGDEAGEHVADGERGGAEARAGDEDAAAGAEQLDERRELGHRRAAASRARRRRFRRARASIRRGATRAPAWGPRRWRCRGGRSPRRCRRGTTARLRTTARR